MSADRGGSCVNRASFWRLLSCAAVICGTIAIPRVAAQSGPKLPADPVEAKVRTACAECHDSEMLLQQRLSRAAWTNEVDKMIRWGAVVDPKDREAIIGYLSSNFPPDKSPYIPAGMKTSPPRHRR